VEDIGYRLKAEESLRDSEARFRAIGDSVHDGIIIVNGKREITYWNPAAEKMFGYTMAEAYGKKLSDLPVIGGDGEHRGLAYYLDPVIDAGLLQPIALTALRRDGAPFFLELTVSFMHVKNEPHCIGSMRDVTERIEMEKRMAEAEEIERERIAQDLHDGLGQHLTGIRYLCGLLIMRLEKEASPLAGQAREVLKLIDEAKDITRNISRGFGMINLEKNGFPLAVKNMLLEAEKMFDISCDFTYDSFDIDTSAASNLYFIIKEAVTNAIRHAHAKKIGVSISSDANKLRVVVTNDGKEYDGIRERQPGLGLKIMNYRLLKINGIMDIRKLEDGGTSLSIIVENKHSSQNGA
jgi:PAS domain S-box-containing protein